MHKNIFLMFFVMFNIVSMTAMDDLPNTPKQTDQYSYKNIITCACFAGIAIGCGYAAYKNPNEVYKYSLGSMSVGSTILMTNQLRHVYNPHAKFVNHANTVGALFIGAGVYSVVFNPLKMKL